MASKLDLVNHVITEVEGLTKKQAAQAVDAIFAAISDYLSEGERVSIHAFGSFSVSHRAARHGRNPATGETIRIRASKNVKFKPARDIKDAVQSASLEGDPTTDYPPTKR